MTWFRCGGSGIPAALKNRMNAVLNKKFGTAVDYPPNGWPNDVNLMGVLPEGTATGSIAHITDGADEVPIKSWEVEIAPTLMGKSAVVCTQTGSNIWDEQWEVGGYNTSTGAKTSATDRIRSKNNIPCKPSTSYCITGGTGGGNVQYWTSSGVFISSEAVSWSLTPKPVITTPNNCYFMTFMSYNNYGNTYNNDIAINYPSTETAYSAHNITVSTVNLGLTIYGGTVDVVKGEGTETEKGKWLSELSWTQNATFPHVFNGTGFTDRKKGINWNNSTCFSDRYTGYTSSEVGSKSEGIALATGATNTTIYVSDDRFSTVAEFTQSLETDDSFVVLPLDTATDFTFTPITPTPETALGVNNFWADTGDTEVTYRADINLALQALSGSRGLMMASRPVTQMAGEESDSDQVNELVEDNETEQEDINDAR